MWTTARRSQHLIQANCILLHCLSLADRVVSDRSGMGEGLPMQIPHESYPNWLNRKEIVEKEDF